METGEVVRLQSGGFIARHLVGKEIRAEIALLVIVMHDLQVFGEHFAVAIYEGGFAVAHGDGRQRSRGVRDKAERVHDKAGAISQVARHGNHVFAARFEGRHHFGELIQRFGHFEARLVQPLLVDVERHAGVVCVVEGTQRIDRAVGGGQHRAVGGVRVQDAREVGHDFRRDIRRQVDEQPAGFAEFHLLRGGHEHLVEHIRHIAAGEGDGLIVAGGGDLGYGEIDAELFAAIIPPPNIVRVALVGALVYHNGNIDNVFFGERRAQAREQHERQKNAKQLLHNAMHLLFHRWCRSWWLPGAALSL